MRLVTTLLAAVLGLGFSVCGGPDLDKPARTRVTAASSQQPTRVLDEIVIYGSPTPAPGGGSMAAATAEPDLVDHVTIDRE